MRPIYLSHGWDTFHWQRLPDGSLQAGISALLWSIYQREPSPAFMAMGDQGDRLVIISINEQHHHLAIALVGAVVRAGTIRRVVAGCLQIKCAHYLQAGTTDLLDDPGNGFITRLFQDQEWVRIAHRSTPLIDFISPSIQARL
jgi:hypothetical protein